MVLYLYVSSVAQNEPTKIDLLPLYTGLPIGLFALLMSLPNRTRLAHRNGIASINYLIISQCGVLVLSLITILLVVLLVVCQVTRFWEGSLRSTI
jgi:hypothetical protein